MKGLGFLDKLNASRQSRNYDCSFRCLSSEKKYGAPVACEQCKLNCAFQKTTESREKVRQCFIWQGRNVSYKNNNVAMLASF